MGRTANDVVTSTSRRRSVNVVPAMVLLVHTGVTYLTSASTPTARSWLNQRTSQSRSVRRASGQRRLLSICEEQIVGHALRRAATKVATTLRIAPHTTKMPKVSRFRPQCPFIGTRKFMVCFMWIITMGYSVVAVCATRRPTSSLAEGKVPWRT